jgi:hypothetical protein
MSTDQYCISQSKNIVSSLLAFREMKKPVTILISPGNPSSDIDLESYQQTYQR